MADKTTTSIIITTYNRVDLLKRSIHSLFNQTYPVSMYEVIVISDGSSDNTFESCIVFKEKFDNFYFFQTERNIGPASARNIGIKHAKGEIILFIDDDCVADKFWVEKMTMSLSQNSIIAGAIESRTDNYWKLCLNISQFYPFMYANKVVKTDFAAGANMGFKKSVLKQLNGLENGRHIAEDIEFCIRARQSGYIVKLQPDAKVIHTPIQKDLGDLLKYTAQHSRFTIQLRMQYSKLLKTPFILKHPSTILLFSPLISANVVFCIFLRNIKLLRHLQTLPIVFLLKMAWCFGAAQSLCKLNK